MNRVRVPTLEVWLAGLVGGLLAGCARRPPAARPEPEVFVSTGVRCEDALRTTRRYVPVMGEYPAVSTAAVSLLAWRTTSDRDRDGLDDTQDCCPELPEDFDGCRDFDGCPDCDDDRDGVPDYGPLESDPRSHAWRWPRRAGEESGEVCLPDGAP